MNTPISFVEESHPMTLTSFLPANDAATSPNKPHRPAGRWMAGGLLLCIGVSASVASWAQNVSEDLSVRPRLRVDRTIGALGGAPVNPQSVPYTQNPVPATMVVPQQPIYYPMTVYVLAPPGAQQQPYPVVQAPPPPAQVMQPAQAPAASAPDAWQVQLTDQTMSIMLRRWAAQAGWQLVWEADRDYPIDSNFSLQGDFLTVLESVMRSVQRSDYPLQAVANTRTRVLRIVRYMDGQRN